MEFSVIPVSLCVRCVARRIGTIQYGTSEKYVEPTLCPALFGSGKISVVSFDGS